MRLHSIAGAITNSSSETYVFPGFASVAGSFDSILRSCWDSWVRQDPEGFLTWARWHEAEYVPRAPGSFEGSYRENAPERVAFLREYGPYRSGVGEDGVPYVWVHMTGTDAPEEFDDYLLAVLGGKRVAL